MRLKRFRWRSLRGFITKPKVWLSGAVVIAIVVTAVFMINMMVKPAQPSTAKSQRGTIALLGITPHMAITDGFSIEGTLTPQDDTTLYYTVTSEDKRTLGAGNISFSGGTFSRNLAFDAKDRSGQKGELRVYVQDRTGQQLDSIAVAVTLQ